MRRCPLSLVDLTVEIREEDQDLVVPESPIWDWVSVDEVDPNNIGDDLREAAIAAPPSDDVVVPTVDGPIIMRLRDGMLGECLQTMGKLEMDSDVDVALGEMMPAQVQPGCSLGGDQGLCGRGGGTGSSREGLCR